MVDDSALQELSSPSLADQAYAAIRGAITTGELPPGGKITERGLASLLSVSATPVREALRRLEQEGLVERRGSRSMVVFSAPDSSRYEMALIQASLRTVAVRLAAMNATDAAIERMQRHLDEADRLRDDMRRSMRDGAEYPADLAERLLLTLRAFHAEMEAACGNAVLLRLLSTVDAFSHQQRVASLRSRVTSGHVLDDRYDEHHQMLAAIRERDADAAERVMARHARLAAEALAP